MRTELISQWTERYQIVGQIILERLLNRKHLQNFGFSLGRYLEPKNIPRLEAVFEEKDKRQGNKHVRQSVNKYLQLLSKHPYEEIIFLKDYGRPKEYRLREDSTLHRQLIINQNEMTKRSKT